MVIIPVLLIAFIVLLVLGVPVAFSLGLPIILFFIFNPEINSAFVAQRITAPLFTYVLLALPAFLLSGRMMNLTGVTNRLLDLAVALVGRFKGGLAYANALASMFFASMSGTAVGDAGGLGLVEIKMMKDAGYDLDHAVGITAASSILGPIIPPSVQMVIFGATAQVSIGRFFIAGIIPGVLMTLGLMFNVWFLVNVTGRNSPWPVTKVDFKTLLNSLFKSILPLMAPVIIIGGIISGIVTPTEAAIVCIVYATFLGVIYRELTFKKLWVCLEETVVMTGVFMFICGVAGFFTWMLTREGLPIMISQGIQGVVGDSATGALFIIALILIIAGTFLDTTPAILLIIPTLLPVVNALNIDMIHFAMVALVALLIGIITPPYGICLFVTSNVAGISVERVTKETLKYMPSMLIVLVLLILFPQISVWLPSLIFK